jgi:uncharacterized membrane protein YqjE
MLTDKVDIKEILKSIFPFRDLEPEKLYFIADRLRKLYFERNAIIYSEGDPAECFYIVANGRVRFSQAYEDGEELISIMRMGDMFGLEVLADFEQYEMSAHAQSNVVLLSLERAHLDEILAELPELAASFDLLAQSYDLFLKTNLNWREEDEPVYFISRRHQMFMWTKMAVPLLISALVVPLLIMFKQSLPAMSLPLFLLGVFGIIVIAWFGWLYIDWRNDYSVITSDRVLFSEKVVLLYDSRQEAPLNAIMAVGTQTDQIGRIFNYGDVIVRTYAGLIVLEKVPAPKQVASLLEAEWFRSKSGIGRIEKMERIQISIRDRLGINPNMEGSVPDESVQTEPMEGELQSGEDVAKAPVPRDLQSSPLLKWLANLFQIRFEQGDTIVYRTHWFMLIKRTLFPGMLLLGLIVLLVLSLTQQFTLLSLSAVLALFLGLGFIFGIWWLYEYVDWRNDFYMVTADQLLDVDKKPLGREEKKSAPLQNIQSISHERLGLMGLLLNFGTVHIRVGDTDLTFDFVSNPSEVQREIYKKLAERRYKAQQREAQAEEQRMADWIEAYHQVVSVKTEESQTEMDEGPTMGHMI